MMKIYVCYRIFKKSSLFTIVYRFIFLAYFFFALGKTKTTDTSVDGTMYGMVYWDQIRTSEAT